MFQKHNQLALGPVSGSNVKSQVAWVLSLDQSIIIVIIIESINIKNSIICVINIIIFNYNE